jgi:hypothetical protein
MVATLGGTLVAVGCFGASKKVETWADKASHDEVCLVIFLLAYIPYKILKSLRDR